MKDTGRVVIDFLLFLLLGYPKTLPKGHKDESIQMSRNQYLTTNYYVLNILYFVSSFRLSSTIPRHPVWKLLSFPLGTSPCQLHSQGHHGILRVNIVLP